MCVCVCVFGEREREREKERESDVIGLNDEQTGCEQHSAHTLCLFVSSKQKSASPPVIFSSRLPQFSRKRLFFAAARIPSVYLIQIQERHTRENTLPLWRYNKPTWDASCTNGEHLYSRATWPLVIAAAFFVPVILRHLRLHTTRYRSNFCETLCHT